MKNPTPQSTVEAVRVRCPMTAAERDTINVLTPQERLDALLAAGRRKMERLLNETEENNTDHRRRLERG